MYTAFTLMPPYRIEHVKAKSKSLHSWPPVRCVFVFDCPCRTNVKGPGWVYRQDERPIFKFDSFSLPSVINCRCS